MHKLKYLTVIYLLTVCILFAQNRTLEYVFPSSYTEIKGISILNNGYVAVTKDGYCNPLSLEWFDDQQDLVKTITVSNDRHVVKHSFLDLDDGRLLISSFTWEADDYTGIPEHGVEVYDSIGTKIGGWKQQLPGEFLLSSGLFQSEDQSVFYFLDKKIYQLNLSNLDTFPILQIEVEHPINSILWIDDDRIVYSDVDKSIWNINLNSSSSQIVFNTNNLVPRDSAQSIVRYAHQFMILTWSSNRQVDVHVLDIDKLNVVIPTLPVKELQLQCIASDGHGFVLGANYLNKTAVLKLNSDFSIRKLISLDYNNIFLDGIKILGDSMLIFGKQSISSDMNFFISFVKSIHRDSVYIHQTPALQIENFKGSYELTDSTVWPNNQKTYQFILTFDYDLVHKGGPELHYAAMESQYLAGFNCNRYYLYSVYRGVLNDGMSHSFRQNIYKMSGDLNKFKLHLYVFAPNHKLSPNPQSNGLIGRLTSTLDVEGKSEQIVFPVPSNNFISLSLKNDAIPYWIEIFSMDGHKMLSCLYNGGEKIDISQIPPGVYLLRVFDNNRRMTAIRWVKN